MVGPGGVSKLYSSHIPSTTLQKTAIAVVSAVGGVLDPERGDLIASLGEVTGLRSLKRLHHTMLMSEEGRLLLKDRPVINKEAVEAAGLGSLPEHTLGGAYSRFMSAHGFSPDSRTAVRFVDDPTLAYVMLRYRQVHDIWHVLSGMPPTVEGEIALKWFEMVHAGLPVAALSALGGPLGLDREGRARLASHLPWALRAGRRAVPLLGVHYETRWQMPLEAVRNELRFEPVGAQLAAQEVHLKDLSC
ncbi:unnamed protein product [Chrysoparadoxa australica]